MSASFLSFGQGNTPDPSPSPSGFSLPADKMAPVGAPSSRSQMFLGAALLLFVVSGILLWWTFVRELGTPAPVSRTVIEQTLENAMPIRMEKSVADPHPEE